MAGPRRIDATLPALGTAAISFHNESAAVLEYMGSNELRRLGNVAHLGVAASVFTGINHTRLEYALLQCAVIGQLAKLHRDDEHLSVSNKVYLNGLKTQVSSGEELLKCWSLLSNFGHAQYTYGVERAILQYGHANKAFGSWLTASVAHQDLKAWCNSALAAYADDRVHHILCLRRFGCEAPRDRRKTLFIHYLRNLLLPTAALFPEDSGKRYKLERLRALYASVRLLTMVALDSYYSGHPIRLNLASAITNLAVLENPRTQRDSFGSILRRTAGWLADEIYLHPDAAAAQREYELQAIERLSTRFPRAARNRADAARFLREVIHDGLGQPRPGRLQHLLRLSFPVRRHLLVKGQNLHATLAYLQAETCVAPKTEVTVDQNRFTQSIHVDFLYHAETSTPSDVAAVFQKIRTWLTRSLEANAIGNVRRFFSGTIKAAEDDERRAELRRRFTQQEIVRHMDLLAELFWGVVRYVLPLGWSARVTEFIAGADGGVPIAANVQDGAGEWTDLVSPALDGQIARGTPALPADRLQELRALRAAVQDVDAPLILVCTEKFLVRDQYGKQKDDWDGVILAVSDAGVTLTVVEAKNTGSLSANETQAYKQLLATRDILRTRHPLRYRRLRIRGLGAKITVRVA